MSDAFPRIQPVISRSQASWLLGLLAAALVLPALGGDAWQYALRYERPAVIAGEYWRLVTGHIVHGTTLHLLLNCAGLMLLAALFPRDYKLLDWLLILAASAAMVDVGLVLWTPQLHWYVGFSGVLHGLLAAGAVAWWRHESRALALALSAIVVAKLGWEQWQGALPLSGDMPVVVDAHLYGAAGGTLAAFLIWLRDQGWSFARRSL